jgi:hypothetical protein
MPKKKKKWIQSAVQKPGSFTKWAKSHGYSGATGEAIAAGLKSKSPTVRRRAALARTLKRLRKKKN